jgi:ribosomal protein L3 glutamine methyltransferase
MSKTHTQTPKLIRPKDAAKDLISVCDFVRYGVSKFNEHGLFYGHGTDNAVDEAVFMVMEGLNLPNDSIDPYWNARLTLAERNHLATLIHKRVETRLPAPYLLNKAYIQGYPFYVDERVIVPRSFIAEILCQPDGAPQIEDYQSVLSVLDLCTGSGCLAIIAAHLFPNAVVDAVDLSPDAVAVAQKNVAQYGLEERVNILQGDLFAPLAGRKYDLIITNPPYVDQMGMEHLPPEFEHEPAMSLAAGEDGLEIVHRIMRESKEYLNDGAGIICELGRCGPDLEAAYPGIDFAWYETENSTGEVFWINKTQL